jgi:hypothetical protein
MIRMTRQQSSKKTAKELKQLDEDHTCKVRTDIVVDDVKDVIGGDEDATVGRPRVAPFAARRGEGATTLQTGGRGAVRQRTSREPSGTHMSAD